MLKGIHISRCRCNERLKGKTDGSKLLGYTGLCGELEHLMIETRLIGESFECVMGESVIEKLIAVSMINLIQFITTDNLSESQ